MMNDDRNNTEYSCGTVSSTVSNPTFTDIVDESDPTILYVAGEYQYTLLQMFLANYNQGIQTSPVYQNHHLTEGHYLV